MDRSCELETRLIAEQPGLEVKADENGRTVIRGYASVFDSPSQDLGGFVEIVERGAFDEVMRSNPDVFGKYNHTRVIGRTSSGTMRLSVDDRGLRYEIDPPRAAADVVELIERGDVRGSSFAFRVRGADETWQKDLEGRMVRRIKRFSFLGDAGPVDTPAYLATETYVSKRALEMAREQRADSPVVEDSAERAAADSFSVGDFVSWGSSGGQARGKITRIVTDGKIDVPDSSFTINGTADDPAVLIRVYQKSGDGYEPSDRLVGHKAKTLTKIDPLPKGENREAAKIYVVGDFVSYGEGVGRVEHVMTEGTLGDADSEYSLEASAEDPAALVRIFEGGEETDLFIGKMMSDLTDADQPAIEEESERAVDLKPTAGMAAAAKRGLKLHAEGKSGDGLKPETVARANRLARRENMNPEWVREMNAWFSRHESASKSPGWDKAGAEKPGFVAWLLWGGTPAKNFSARKVKQLESERSIDIVGEIASLKAAMLRTHLHAKR